ncbi:MAG: Holliday junction resolvase RuvX [Actinomycetota bacterium]|nr:Holliday junction resolvase RuvX [Actinomycetota bacterium]
MRPGVRLGVDPGRVRIGVAVSDADGLLATPLATVPAGAGQWQRLAELAAQTAAVEIVVGMPLLLSGAEGQAARDARDFGGRLAERTGLPVRLVDERLSTVEASRSLRGAGRTARSSRNVVDQAAAVVLLQAALDAERSSGRPAGVEVLAPPIRSEERT